MQEIFIRCVQDMGCSSMSSSHFTALLAGGFIEVMFEMTPIIKIYKLTAKGAREEELKQKELENNNKK